MWTCSHCGRIFEKQKQPHSCQKIPLEQHFENKEKAKEIFTFLLHAIEKDIGKCHIISLPCCVHLFGTYDFLAALPKKEKLEIRFALDRKLQSQRLKACVPVSANTVKNCIDISSTKEIDNELIGWMREAYFLKKSSLE
jgi:hypothetical protein